MNRSLLHICLLVLHIHIECHELFHAIDGHHGDSLGFLVMSDVISGFSKLTSNLMITQRLSSRIVIRILVRVRMLMLCVVEGRVVIVVVARRPIGPLAHLGLVGISPEPPFGRGVVPQVGVLSAETFADDLLERKPEVFAEQGVDERVHRAVAVTQPEHNVEDGLWDNVRVETA